MDFARAGLGGGIRIEADREADVARTIEQVVDELRSIPPERTIEAIVEIDAPVRADWGGWGSWCRTCWGMR
jgi:hypothetical protein